MPRFSYFFALLGWGRGESHLSKRVREDDERRGEVERHPLPEVLHRRQEVFRHLVRFLLAVRSLARLPTGVGHTPGEWGGGKVTAAAV